MSDPIKRGDTPTLAWDLDPAPAGGSTVRVIIARPGRTPIVSRAGTIAGARVTITLTAAETAVAADYVVEFEATSGGTVTTYPNGGYEKLRIMPDLDSTT